MTSLPLEKVKELYYNKGYSAREIGDIFGVSIKVVYVFMRKMNLARRNLSEQNRVLFERKLPSFNLKRNLTKTDYFMLDIRIKNF